MNGERGYTLAESMIVLTIIGIIVTVIGMAAQHMITVPEKCGDRVESLHAVQNAAHWIALDIQSSYSAECGDSLNLTMPDGSVIRYLRSGNTLYRYCDGGNMTIARNITAMNFTVNDRLITMNITAAPESRWDISANGTYQVAMRPSGVFVQ